jgi:transglutaminase-like putative cysteine protease/predicted glutamine amidotransferase
MPNLLAISVEGESAPSFDLTCLHPGKKPPDGWGIGYYPAGEPSAAVLKEPAPRAGSIRSELVKAWESLASPLFVLHIRRAMWGANTDANTQPFLRSFAGHDWLFCHAGSLRDRIETPEGRRFTAVGSTDTERIFCELMSRIAERGWKRLGDADLAQLHAWFREFDHHGSVTCVLTDGVDLCCYADVDDGAALYVREFLPPYGQLCFSDDDVVIDLAKRGVKSTKGVVIANTALTTGDGLPGEWRKLEPGTLIVVRQGAVRAEVTTPEPVAEAGIAAPIVYRPTPAFRPSIGEVKRMSVRHVTRYEYSAPVERSSHVLRLTPYHDRLQRLLEHELRVSVDGEPRDYEDVFGNRVRGLQIDTPYSTIEFEARSLVELLDAAPLDFRSRRTRSSLPLVFMPWQRHMLTPYLLPPELPETQLGELLEYAQSFVKRNDGDLIDTLLDMNGSIFREFQYVSGSTTLSTTAFETYAVRRGVCQDFANLFICLARLLGVPARYACGYIYTGPKNQNHVQSEASHAWVQVYVPEAGWKGFDPTNGILTQTDHVRVAVGRNYVDATPTAGTIWVGGGAERLTVEVEVDQVD